MYHAQLQRNTYTIDNQHNTIKSIPLQRGIDFVENPENQRVAVYDKILDNLCELYQILIKFA